MKKIVPYICLAFFGLFIAVGAEVFFPQEGTRVWHHRTENLQYCDNLEEGKFCTHLPLVKIDTKGQKLDFVEEILASMEIVDHTGGHNHLDGEASLETDLLIKMRGNSSSRFDKKQYRLTFVDSSAYGSSTENLQELEHVSHKVMGMPPESEWILNGPFLDKTLLRNYLMYNLSGELMDWAPNVRYCEVFLDGEYQGIYLMLETVKADENRVNIKMLDENNTATDYMVARERIGDTAYPLDNFGTYSGKTYNELGLTYPGVRSGRTEEQLEYIRQDISAAEKMLYSLDYDDQKIGYKSAIDTQSFADYFILNEFSMNVDAGGLSTYMYKEVGSGFKMGPVWDFNNGFDNYEYYALDMDEFYLISNPWYVMLLRDEEFVEQIINRYSVLREGILSEKRINELIDETITFLGPAVARNDDVWGYSYKDNWLDNFDMELQPLSYDRNPENYEDAVLQLKECIKKRGRFLDENIHVLRQFCAESKVKEWN